MRVVVVGVGYVGLTTAGALAELGHRVVGLDIDRAKIDALRSGSIPIFEPGLEAIVRSGVDAGRLAFTDSYPEACAGAELIMCCVDTPTGENWETRLDPLEKAAAMLAEHAPAEALFVLKSTVPPGTNEYFARTLAQLPGPHTQPIVISNPEFLREGQAVRDTFYPDRIVIGASEPRAFATMRTLLAPIIAGDYHSAVIPAAPAGYSTPVPVVEANPATAELIKYAANAFLATKISFINEIANLSEEIGADVVQVAEGIGLDSRIGRQFLRAGVGFGGSCFPKDAKALSYKAGTKGYQFTLLNAVIEVNKLQRFRFLSRIRNAYGSALKDQTLAVLGLAFKPQTDDVREAPALDLMRELALEGATLRATDPVAIEKARAVYPGAEYLADPYICLSGADGAIVVTEWPEYIGLDWARAYKAMRTPIVFDGRNCLDPTTMRGLGFTYYGVGRG